jgi:hypothetical protein
MWDNLLFTGTGFKNGGSSSHLEVNLMDKSSNSLKQLHNYFGTLALLKKKQQDQFKDYPVDVQKMVDSIKTK